MDSRLYHKVMKHSCAQNVSMQYLLYYLDIDINSDFLDVKYVLHDRTSIKQVMKYELMISVVLDRTSIKQDTRHK